jgi:2-polyprenyl-3-methyl-5-hydroxy-6-metoxy-1,4-benzoquinol methylase
MSINFWNQRYEQNTTVYGIEPNEFLKEQLSKVNTGKILLPAEGEGRNAVYAARLGWTVHAFDYSDVARQKALAFAQASNVHIEYNIETIEHFNAGESSFEAVALIYVHVFKEMRKTFHQKCIHALRPGGVLILEGFSTNQINNNSGGPKDPEMLFTLEELLDDFKSLQIDQASIEEVKLNEGPFHQGTARIIRIAATNPVN